MNIWCKIIEHNNKQFLFRKYYDVDRDLEVMTCTADFSEDYPDTGVGMIEYNVIAEKNYSFTQKEFEDFAILEKVLSSLQKMLKIIMRIKTQSMGGKYVY